jgi:hypothetical protein
MFFNAPYLLDTLVVLKFFALLPFGLEHPVDRKHRLIGYF